MSSTADLGEPTRSPAPESGDLLRSVVEDLPDLVCRFRPDGVLTYVNRAYCRYFDTTPERLVGRSFFEFLPPDDEALVREKLGRLTPERSQSITEHRVMVPTGEVRWHQWTDQALFAPDGELLGFQSVGRDVTRYRRALERLQRHERLASIGTLAAGIAHEINNPLGAILLAAQSALRYMERGDPAITREALQLIESEALRCGSIVKSVLRFSLAESTERWVVGLNESANSARHLTRKYVEERGARIELDLAEEDPRGRYNPTEIELVLVHLIRDAVESGHGATHIVLRTARDGPWVRLSVEHDVRNGGEAADELEGEPRGVSVGRSIVEQYDGTLEVERGGGSQVVTVSLPGGAEG